MDLRVIRKEILDLGVARVFRAFIARLVAGWSVVALLFPVVGQRVGVVAFCSVCPWRLLVWRPSARASVLGLVLFLMRAYGIRTALRLWIFA